jgi:hypothetical protein
LVALVLLLGVALRGQLPGAQPANHTAGLLPSGLSWLPLLAPVAVVVVIGVALSPFLRAEV